jgi:hypothetical protein
MGDEAWGPAGFRGFLCSVTSTLCATGYQSSAVQWEVLLLQLLLPLKDWSSRPPAISAATQQWLRCGLRTSAFCGTPSSAPLRASLADSAAAGGTQGAAQRALMAWAAALRVAVGMGPRRFVASCHGSRKDLRRKDLVCVRV